MAEEEDIDPVIKEHPLRPTFRPMDLPNGARLKPQHEILQLEYNVERDEFYDDEAEDASVMRTHRLESSRIPPRTQYALGVVREGEIHLTPIQGILQMRPALSHVDQRQDESIEVEDKMDEETGAGDEVKQLNVVYKRRQSERALAAKRNSYAYKKELEEGEKWIDLAVHGEEAEETAQTFELLIAESDNHISYDINKQTFLSSFSVREASSETQTGEDGSGKGTKEGGTKTS